MEILDNAELETSLAKLGGWEGDSRQIEKSWKFKDFVSAFGFLSQVAILAEKEGHHPEIFNVYSNVTLKLSTHDAGDRVTSKDISLAKAINGIGSD